MQHFSFSLGQADKTNVPWRHHTFHRESKFLNRKTQGEWERQTLSIISGSVALWFFFLPPASLSLDVLGFSTWQNCCQGLPRWLSGKEPSCTVGDTGLIPGLGRSPGEGHGHTLRYSCLENPIDRVAWWIIVLGVANSQIRLKRLNTPTLGFERADLPN